MVKFAISLYIFILIIVVIAIVLRNKIKSEEIKKYNETLEEKRQEGFYKIVPVTVRDIEVNAIFRDSHLPLIRVWSINVSDEKLRQALYSRLYR